MSGGKPVGEDAAAYRVDLLPMVAGALVAGALVVAEATYFKIAAGADPVSLDPVSLRPQNLPRSEEATEKVIARYSKRSRLYESICGSVRPAVRPIYFPIAGGELAERLVLAGWHQKGPAKVLGLFSFPRFAGTS